MELAAPFSFLPADPPPAEVWRLDGTAPLVLACEHAGRLVPESLKSGLPPPEDMDRHIAYDVGAGAVASGLADKLDASLVLQRYSRLVIDCNRQRNSPDLAPAVSDGSAIPFNYDLTEAELEARWQAIHQPFHQTLADMLDTRRSPVALITIHSFTPRLRGGDLRPMELGLLMQEDLVLAQSLREQTLALAPELRVDFDAPYFVNAEIDYTVPHHAVARGLPHVLIEIRNDLICDEQGIARWVDLLSDSISASLKEVLPRR